MSELKTIAVYAADEVRADKVFGVACALAAQHDAHLTGLFAMPPDLNLPVFALGRQLTAAGDKILRERSERLGQLFERIGSALQVKKEWRRVEAHHQAIPTALASHLRATDLVVTSQRDPGWEDSLLLEFPEELVMTAGRPVLVVPKSTAGTTVGRRVVLAWNDKREAARAAFDALPMLAKAEQVRIVWVNPNREAAFSGDVPTAGIAAALARHNVKCVSSVAYGPDASVGDVLLNECADFGADLLVMGGYGHTRLREYVLGGATRHILKSMTVPVMLSH